MKGTQEGFLSRQIARPQATDFGCRPKSGSPGNVVAGAAQEGFLSRQINPPYPKGISSPLRGSGTATNCGHRPQFAACAWAAQRQGNALGVRRVIARERNPSWVPFTLSSLPPSCSADFFDRLRSCTNSRSIQICEAKLSMTRRKIAGILCVLQDFSTQSAAILAA